MQNTMGSHHHGFVVHQGFDDPEGILLFYHWVHERETVPIRSNILTWGWEVYTNPARTRYVFVIEWELEIHYLSEVQEWTARSFDELETMIELALFFG